MAKAKIIILILSLLPFAAGSQSFELTWSQHAMDGSRTGCVCASADNAALAIGTVSDGVYTAPNGRVFSGGCTADVASILLAAQGHMSEVKQVIAYSPREMVRSYPECELSNLFVDVIMDSVEELSGKHVDVGIGNFGGIRVDMPQGDVLLDDILSMFPFKNSLVYLELPGSELLKIFDWMAATQFQVLGGVEIVAKGKKLDSVLIGGQPLDPERMYSVATISFLLHGGDGLHLAEGAENLVNYPVDIIDVILPYIKGETAAGRPIEYHVDGRVRIL